MINRKTIETNRKTCRKKDIKELQHSHSPKMKKSGGMEKVSNFLVNVFQSTCNTLVDLFSRIINKPGVTRYYSKHKAFSSKSNAPTNSTSISTNYIFT